MKGKKVNKVNNKQKMKNKESGEKKVKQYLIAFLLLLLVFMSGFIIARTYSRYSSNSTGNASAKVATWKVKVNNTNITDTQNFTISDIKWSESDNIEDGYIAPGRTGTFEIKIDPSDSKVAIDFEVSIDATNNLSAANEDIKIKSVQIDNDTVQEESSRHGVYKGSFTLDEVKQNKVKTVKVTIEWENKESHNTEDTTTGKTKTDAITIPVVVTATQHIDAQ